MICKACKRHFKLKKENRYLIRTSPSIQDVLIGKPTTFEAFDCDKCGCQNIIGVREINIIDEETERMKLAETVRDCRNVDEVPVEEEE